MHNNIVLNMKHKNIQPHQYIKVTYNYNNFDKCINSYKAEAKGTQLIILNSSRAS